LILSLAVFATMVGNSVVIPFLPLYVHQYGVSEFGAGLLFSVHAATRIVVLPFIGRLSDRWERKTFLLIGVLCYTLSSLAYMPASQLPTFVAVMVIHDTATAVVHPVAMAYVGELAPKGQEGRYSGYINSALLGGIAGGPMWREKYLDARRARCEHGKAAPTKDWVNLIHGATGLRAFSPIQSLFPLLLDRSAAGWVFLLNKTDTAYTAWWLSQSSDSILRSLGSLRLPHNPCR
jgi:MFS family permease